jgi:DNA-binding MarR family transcriptional regulator
LRHATVDGIAARRCAAGLLASVPAVMRFIRQEMRAHRQAQLSVPQFRALVFVSLSDEPSLSAMAEHLGLSLPAASRLVDLLVKRGLMGRRVDVADRRRVSLSLTARGRATCRRARRATQAALARRFERLSAQDLALVSRALGILGHAFAAGGGRAETVE